MSNARLDLSCRDRGILEEAVYALEKLGFLKGSDITEVNSVFRIDMTPRWRKPSSRVQGA